MNVPKHIVEYILDNASIGERGCHAPHNETPLDGRRAYYMIDHVKVTFPVKSLKPTQSTLRAGLIKEMQRRFASIGFALDVNWSGTVSVVERDPYSVLPLLTKYVDGKNERIHMAPEKRGAK
jgi:hypothetical protein